MRDKPALALLSLSFLGGCLLTQQPAEPLVRTYATKDLDCPNEDIRVMKDWGGKYKAVGCGRKAYYQTMCDGLKCEVHPEGEEFVPWKDRPDPGDRTAR